MRIFGRIIYYSQLLKRSQAAPPLRGQWIENASRQGRHYRLYSVMIRICVLTVLALLTCGLAHAEYYENGAKLYQHTDHLGSPVAGTDATGSVAWRERYTPYGEKLLKPDALNNQASFTGHIFDEPTGLTYMQARYYDPNIGRFLSIDPMTMFDADMNPGMFNRYAYTMNDPINLTDPTGMCSEDGKSGVCPDNSMSGQLEVKAYENDQNAGYATLDSEAEAKGLKVTFKTRAPSNAGPQAIPDDPVAASNGTGSNVTVWMEPGGSVNMTTTSQTDAEIARDGLKEQTTQASQTEIRIHEADTHALQMVRGTWNRSQAPTGVITVSGSRAIPSEADAVNKTNTYRSSRNPPLPRRTRY